MFPLRRILWFIVWCVSASITQAQTPPSDLYACPADAFRMLQVRDDEPRPEIAARAANAAPLPRSIAIWGDSHLAAATFAAELRRVLEARGETAAPNFIAPYFDRPGVAIAVRAFCASRAWRLSTAHASRTNADYGPALAQFASDVPGEFLWLDLRDAQGLADVLGLRLLFEAHPSEDGTAAAIDLTLDDGTERRITLEGDAQGVGELTLGREQAIGLVRICVANGRFALRGIAPWRPSRSPSTLRLDVFAIPGATAQAWANVDPQRMASSLGADAYELVALEYGTNEGGSFEAVRYRAMLAQAITHLRAAFPQARCVLLGPPDRGVRSRKMRGDRLRYSRIHARINVIQAELAHEYGCLHFDWQRAMGGPGTAYLWAKKKPALMSGDLTHLTRTGTRRAANDFARFLGW